MSDLRAIGERLVAEAKPRFKDFRVDFEKISTAASKYFRGAGQPEKAAAMFHDVDWDLRMPLQRRYVEHGAFGAVAHYHSKRFKLLLGRNEPWPDDPAADALRLFADHSRADLGVALIRTYGDMQLKRLKQDYSTRNPRGSRKQRAPGVERAIAAIGSAIAAAIPDRKAELLRDLEATGSYIAEHGTSDDQDWMEGIHREIWMEKRA